MAKDQGVNTKYELLVIGGSAGSLAMVLKILPLLRAEMKMSVILLFHRKASEDNMLVEMIAHRTDFEVREAEDKDEIRPGVVYIAPADYHLLIEKEKYLSLDASEKVNYSRPSIDVTFETAAEAYGDSLICILLSGANADGVEGLLIAKNKDACIVVQDPASAEFSIMPQQALQRMDADLLLSEGNLGVLQKILLQGS